MDLVTPVYMSIYKNLSRGSTEIDTPIQLSPL